MKLADFLIAEEGNDSKPLPDGRFASTYDKLGRCWNIAAGITKGVGPNTIWTQAQIDAAEASEFADVEACIARCVKVQLTENQRVACESLAYNVGDEGFATSTVLRDINAGKLAEAAQAFLMWDKCHGVVVPGLVNRRKDEIKLFNIPDSVPVPADLRAVKTAITATANPEATIMATTTAGPAAVTPATVTVPVSTLKSAANVSQATIKTTFTLGGLGGMLAIVGPMLAMMFPSEAHTVVAAATSIAGLGVAATAFVHALGLSASAEAVTNAFIDSVTGISSQVSADLGGASA